MTCVAHHWLLADGLTNVLWRCLRWGEERMFNASGIPTDDWTGTTSAYVLADPKRTAASRARARRRRRRRT